MKIEQEEVLTPGLGKVSINQVPVQALVGRTVNSLSGEEKLQLCHAFFLSGNLSELARAHRVHYVELRAMSEEEWWLDEILRLRRESTAIARAKITTLLGATIGKLEERLAEGDPHVSFGQVVYAPVKAADLARIAATLFLKEKELAEVEERTERVKAKERLGLIAEALRGQVMIEDGQVLEEGERK